MSSKNISLREDVYQELKATKGEDESFSDVVERLLESEQDDHPLYAISGIIDEGRADELHEHVEEVRADVDEEMDRS